MTELSLLDGLSGGKVASGEREPERTLECEIETESIREPEMLLGVVSEPALDAENS
jgi:hypothetical protein